MARTVPAYPAELRPPIGRRPSRQERMPLAFVGGVATNPSPPSGTLGSRTMAGADKPRATQPSAREDFRRTAGGTGGVAGDRARSTAPERLRWRWRAVFAVAGRVPVRVSAMPCGSARTHSRGCLRGQCGTVRVPGIRLRLRQAFPVALTHAHPRSSAPNSRAPAHRMGSGDQWFSSCG